METKLDVNDPKIRSFSFGSSPLRKTFVNMAIRWTKFNIIKSNEINRPRSNYKGKIDSLVTELPNHGRYHGNLPMIERDREQLSANFLMEHINVEQRNLIVVLMMDLGITLLLVCPMSAVHHVTIEEAVGRRYGRYLYGYNVYFYNKIS